MNAVARRQIYNNNNNNNNSSSEGPLYVYPVKGRRCLSINYTRRWEFVKPMQICYINDMPLSDDEVAPGAGVADDDDNALYTGLRDVSGSGLEGIAEDDGDDGNGDLEDSLKNTYLVDDDEDEDGDDDNNNEVYIHEKYVDSSEFSDVTTERTHLIDDNSYEDEVAPLDLPKLPSDYNNGATLLPVFKHRHSIVDDDEDEFLPKQIQPPVKLKSPSPPHHSSDNDLIFRQTKTKSSEEDFFAKQARLQAEARMALAQVRPMAHMQLEVERQKKKKSPIAEIVGLPTKIGRRKHLNGYLLLDMNLAQLQVLVNDLHGQIEGLNEELVKLLVDRDDLHMEQDSMLVDIEDLTRRAQEHAARLNTKLTNSRDNTSCNSSSRTSNHSNCSVTVRDSKSNRKGGKKK